MNGCGWCPDNHMGQCLAGNKTGPTNQTCNGWQFENCYDCSAVTDCKTCTEVNKFCQWCSNAKGGSCEPLGGAACIILDCPCTDYRTCTECMAEKRCNFCLQDAICVEEDTKCDGPTAHTCPPCSSHKDCSKCNADFPCGWCKSKKSCVNYKEDTNCLIQHICDIPSDGGFDAGSFVGGIFLGAFLVAIVGGLVYFTIWRKKQGYQAV